jgi:hypothetical protein
MKDDDAKSAVDAVAKESRRPYVKPEVRRVELALEETLSGGCKLWAAGSPCGEDDFSVVLESGS